MIVRTTAGLEALPEKTVVLDAEGDAWQLHKGWWRRAVWGLDPQRSGDLVDLGCGPFRTMRTVDE